MTDEVVDQEDQVETPKEEVQTEVSYTEAEQRAMSLGWKPEEKWVEDGNDPKRHRSAEDFLERGEMIGKLRSQDNELRSVKDAVKKLVEQNQQMYERGFKQAVADLKAQKKEALAEGDLVRAEEYQEKIEDLKERQSVATPPAPKQVEPDPEFQPWLQQNQWYQDPVMREIGDGLARAFINANNGNVTAAQVRDYVASTVKKEFAHRFEGGKKVVGAPNPDSSGRQSNKEKGSSNLDPQLRKIEAEMDDQDVKIMNTILKATPKLTKQEYLKMYANPKTTQK